MKGYNYFAFVIALGISLMIGQHVVMAKLDTNYVDMVLKVNSTDYISKGVKKKLDVTPFIDNGRTMVPFRTIFEEMGYNILWNQTDLSITAIKDQNYDYLSLKVNSKIAKVNGQDLEMDVSPKIVQGRVFVPLRFVSESAGAQVEWNQKEKSIAVSKFGKFDTGNVMFLNKSEGRSDIYQYNGKDLINMPFFDNEVLGYFPFRGQALLNVHDKNRDTSIVVLYRNKELEILIDNFEIKETFEYNGNLLIHGYDRFMKFNKLYRFDGENIHLIVDNFCVGKHFTYKNQLMINSYNDSRNYSLVVLTKNSWEPVILKNGFIVRETRELQDNMYLTGSIQTGNSNIFACYDGNIQQKDSFKIISQNMEINLKKMCAGNNRVYFIIDGNLKTFDGEKIEEPLYQVEEEIYAKFSVLSIASVENKVYFTTNGVTYYDSRNRELYDLPRDKYGKRPSLVKIESQGESEKFSVILSNTRINVFKEVNGKLVVMAAGNGENGGVLYVYDKQVVKRVFDVFEVKNIVASEDRIFIAIKDRDRIFNKDRDTILLYENGEMKNVVLNFELDKWSLIGNILIFSGMDTEARKYKVYLYKESLKQLLDNDMVHYWNNSNEFLIMGVRDRSTQKFLIYGFRYGDFMKIAEDIEILKGIKVKGEFVLIYGYPRDKQALRKNNIYVYDNADKSLSVLKLGVELTDIIYSEKE